MKKLVVTAIAAMFASSAALADTQTGIDAFNNKEFDVALKELMPPATAGDPNAAFFLAQMYSQGFGVEQNLTKALALYAEAAANGHVPSQKEYGTALALGEGADQNVSEGLKWLLIAARAGDESARALAARFSRIMRRTVILTARKQAIEWHIEFKNKNSQANKKN